MIVQFLRSLLIRQQGAYAVALAARPAAARPSAEQLKARKWLDLGAHHVAGGRLAKAGRAFARALEADDANPAALSNLAAILTGSEPQTAIQYLRRAEKLQPRDAVIQFNLGCACENLGKADDAARHYAKALAFDEDHIEARRNLALLNLAAGWFTVDNWKGMQARWLARDFNRSHLLHGVRYLNDERVPRQRVLVHMEQGLGDEIFLAACLFDLRELVREVAVTCEPRLEELFVAAFPGIDFIPRRGAWKKRAQSFAPDCQVYGGDLPYWFRRGAASFPRPGAYLRADAGRAAHWRQRLVALGPGLKVGISWRGGLESTGRALRSIPLAQWGALFALPGIHWIDLQYGDDRTELHAARTAGVPITRFEDGLRDYGETAALVSELDLVISVTTAVVDLAGALNRPCWVFVPCKPLWKFGIKGHRTPWYPSLRLFRQGAGEDWGSILQTAAQQLRRSGQIPLPAPLVPAQA